jgi:pyruvate dehydrogenase E1 component
MAFPCVRSYDPAWGYETAVIVLDGLRRLYEEGETGIYYLTLTNENYAMPAMPDGAEQGIIRGIYRFATRESSASQHRVNLFGSGAILRCVIAAAEILAERYGVASNIWSVTSYTQLRREAQACERWNMLHPTLPPRKSFLETALTGESGLFVAASDYVRALPEQLTRWIPGELYVLGTDGMGRSETREALRRHFEVDAESIVVATLSRLARQGKIAPQVVAQAIKQLGVNPEKVDPASA